MKIENKEGNYVTIELYMLRAAYPFRTIGVFARLLEVLADKEILNGIDIVRIVEDVYREAHIKNE